MTCPSSNSLLFINLNDCRVSGNSCRADDNNDDNYDVNRSEMNKCFSVKWEVLFGSEWYVALAREDRIYTASVHG